MSSNPHILISLGFYAHTCILASSYPHVRVYLVASSHPYILISSGSYAFAYIPPSLYPQVRVCLFVSLHPHILRFICISLYPCILIYSSSCVLAYILGSSHLTSSILRFMRTCWYPHILTSPYPQVCVCLLVCSHL